jgi:hypothetical protein
VASVLLVKISKSTYQLTFDVPRTSFVFGLLRGQVNICQLYDHLKAPLVVVPPDINSFLWFQSIGRCIKKHFCHVVWNARRLKSPGFGLRDYLDTLDVFIVFIFIVFIACAIIVDAVKSEGLSFYGSKGEIPERDGRRNNFFDDRIQILVFLGMEVVNIARDPTMQIVKLALSCRTEAEHRLGTRTRHIDFAWKPLKLFAVGTRFLSLIGILV